MNAFVLIGAAIIVPFAVYASWQWWLAYRAAQFFAAFAEGDAP